MRAACQLSLSGVATAPAKMPRNFNGVEGNQTHTDPAHRSFPGYVRHDNSSSSLYKLTYTGGSADQSGV
jgi:hypothetical protein